MGWLSDLQERVLVALAGMMPAWKLTGGAALAGFHLGHRKTRDLDLFWADATSIADVRRDVVARLRAVGFSVDELRTHEAFAVIRVTSGAETVVVDLVADPVPPIEPPRAVVFQGVHVLLDTPHEILVNKLCALLHRSELRDLLDIEALVAEGGDLDRALMDAGRKDGGFSGLTLGWTLQGWNVAEVAREAGLAGRAEELEAFRDRLMERAAGGPP